MKLHTHFARKAVEAEANQRYGEASKEWRHAMLSTDSPGLKEDYRAKWMKADMTFGRKLIEFNPRYTPG